MTLPKGSSSLSAPREHGRGWSLSVWPELPTRARPTSNAVLNEEPSFFRGGQGVLTSLSLRLDHLGRVWKSGPPQKRLPERARNPAASSASEVHVCSLPAGIWALFYSFLILTWQKEVVGPSGRAESGRRIRQGEIHGPSNGPGASAAAPALLSEINHRPGRKMKGAESTARASGKKRVGG